MSDTRLPDPIVHRETCRVCDQPLVPVLSLGTLAINAFPFPGDPLPPTAPLTLGMCRSCALVQLYDTVDLERLYRQYWYQSGINEAMVAELADVIADVAAAQAQAGACCGSASCWIDIGANDGTLLRLVEEAYHKSFPPLLRVAWEPARNLFDALQPHCEVLYPDFFPPKDLHEISGLEGRAYAITTIAMFYDLPDPHAFVAAIKKLLHPDGVWIIQLQDLATMIETGSFDAICHEHLEYYSTWALARLLAQHGLRIVEIQARAINGGSLRYQVRHIDAKLTSRRSVLHQFDREQGLNVHTFSPHAERTFGAFAWRMHRMRNQLQTILARATHLGQTIDAYGASTKGNILLSYCEFDDTLIRQAIERSPAKVGRRTATGIPIVSEATGRQDPAELWIVPIWQFKAGILQREVAYLEQGGRMLFPLPAAEIVEMRR